MSRSRDGPSVSRHYHHSGRRRDSDDGDDAAYDYDYYTTYDDYSRSRDGGARAGDRRRPRSFDNRDEPLHDSSDDDKDYDRQRRQKRKSGGGVAADGSRSLGAGGTRGAGTGSSRDIGSSHSPRAAAAESALPVVTIPYNPPRGRPPLPAGWVPQYNRANRRWFYHNKATGRSQWEAPGFEVERLKSRGLAPVSGPARGVSPGRPGSSRSDANRRSGESLGHRSRRHSGLSATGVLLGAAGGIAAGTLIAKALHSRSPSARSSSDRSGGRSRSAASKHRDRDRDRDRDRNRDQDDFEDDFDNHSHHSHHHHDDYDQDDHDHDGVDGHDGDDGY